MLGGFLVLNMIVGVVVENFQRCREKLEDEEKQRRRRKLLEKAENRNQEGRCWPEANDESEWQESSVGKKIAISTIIVVLKPSNLE